MNESVAPARRLALRLGEDLGRILDSADLEVAEPDVVVSPPANTELELRQIAGLTAGSSMPLGTGSYQFGPAEHGRGLAQGDPSEVGFRVQVADDQTVMLLPAQAEQGDAGQLRLRLEGVDVTEPTVLAPGAVIDAGSARFQLGPRRAMSRRRRTTQRVERALSAVERDVVTPTLEEIAAAQLEVPRRRTRGPVVRLTRRNVQTAEAVTQLFVDRLASHRAEMLANRRAAHPNPEALLHQARHAAELAGDCDRTHRAFAQVAIASGDETWVPRFAHPERVPDGVSPALSEWYTAPSVPQVADLRRGPVGIVGDRSATLAVARQILLTIATRSAPSDAALMVMANEEREHDWAWAAHLPHAHRRYPDALPIVFVDDVEQLDGDLSDPLLETGGVGTILLATSADELPPICPTVMTLHPSGTATVVHHDTHTTILNATPIGITAELASSAVSSLVKGLATRT